MGWAFAGATVYPFAALIAIITAQRETARRRALVAEQEVDSYADKLELDNRLLSDAIVQASQELHTSFNNKQVQVLAASTSNTARTGIG